MSARPKILIVDDRAENLIALAELLREQEAEVLAARSGDEALVLLLEHEIAVALVDVQMPEIDGFMLAELMRGAERTREIPIILVTAGFQDPKRVFKGYELGAVDFLHKPIEPQILRSKVSVFVRLHEQKTQLLETQRRLERALAEAYEAAAVRERVASLVSHDLRNPLSTIAMQTEMLKALRAAGRMSESIVDDGLERIERGITKMERLIDELLDVTQLQAGQELRLDRRDVDLVALARQIVEDHAQSTAAHTIELRTEMPSLIGRWDEVRLERVLDNLMSNAVKYSPGGGRVRVDVRRCRAWDTDWALVLVQDEGVGIPADSLPRLFRWFARADNVRPIIPGTGLGLAGVRQIVIQHGGGVSVRSREGEGSVFGVGLPLEPRSPAESMQPADWEWLLFGS